MRIKDLIYLQDFAFLTRVEFLKVKESMVLEKIYTLIDAGSGIEYKIAKLKDNRIWFMENYRIGSNEETTTLLPEYYNVGEQYTLPKGVSVEEFGTGSFYIDERGGYYSFPVVFHQFNKAKNILPIGWKVPTKEDFDTMKALYRNKLFNKPVPGFVASGIMNAKQNQYAENAYYWTENTTIATMLMASPNGSTGYNGFGQATGGCLRGILIEPEEG